MQPAQEQISLRDEKKKKTKKKTSATEDDFIETPVTGCMVSPSSSQAETHFLISLFG